MDQIFFVLLMACMKGSITAHTAPGDPPHPWERGHTTPSLIAPPLNRDHTLVPSAIKIFQEMKKIFV